MKLLVVTSVDAWTRSVSTLHHFVAAGKRLGHDVAIFGESDASLPNLAFSTDLRGVDLALFVIQVPSDFPDMPALAHIIDGVPRKRRAVVDLWGRYNETIRIDHDFNHLEKLDGHLGWEWDEAIKAVSELILQPTLRPLRKDVRPYLFHGFDPAAVVRPSETPQHAAERWRSASLDEKPFGVMYVGSNWQRWEQVRRFLTGYAGARHQVGRACLIGWDWGARPDWAVEKGIMGIDSDAEFLKSLDVEIRHGVRFDEVVDLLGQARFAPIFHRPLFGKLGFVTARSFETFYADTIPVLCLPRDFVADVYGPSALSLIPGDSIAGHLKDVLARPVHYWQAVFDTREHLAREHSFERRYDELARLTGAVSTGAAG
ncbi:MAG: hypothetical protein AB7L90_19805 [Hyphomicrobiaceae bacterium]